MLSLSPPRCIPDRRDRGAQNVRLNELKRTFVSRPIRRYALGERVPNDAAYNIE
jgi:hypothetical protein